MKAKDLDLLFYSLSDETRRSILTLLSKGEMTFGEITENFSSSKQAISKHLMILEQAGFVKKNKEGRICHCKFTPEPLDNVVNVVEKYRQFWGKQLKKLDSYLDQL